MAMCALFREIVQVRGVVYQVDGKVAIILHVKDVHGTGFLMQSPEAIVAPSQHRAEQYAVDDGV